jgi:decaprenylphospho-beta-D-ribofuranose 2-oxidase
MVKSLFYRGIQDGTPYIDLFENYAFIGDGHRRVKAFGTALGFRVPTIQQTFLIPKDHLQGFFNELHSLEGHSVTPFFFDIVFVKADDFLLSANNGLNAYAVSVEFEYLSAKQIAQVRERLKIMSGRCHALGGRVYLVKNVHATPEQVRHMYAPAMEKFLALKKQLDPEGLLRNDFYEKIFGAMPGASL